MSEAEYHFAIVTISDRCSNGTAVDQSGPYLVEAIGTSGDNFKVVHSQIIPDDVKLISDLLTKLSGGSNLVDCVITTGGTGFTKRDVTPEATKAVIDKEAPGLVQALLAASLKATPMAMLSRLTAGILNETLIINFPGSKKACVECLEVVRPVLKHAIDQLRGEVDAVQAVHHQLGSRHQQSTRSKVTLTPSGLRDRESPYEIVSIDEAATRLVTELRRFLQQSDSIKQAGAKCLSQYCGYVLAEDIHAQVALPPFDASIKDGYAVIAEDEHTTKLVHTKTIHAGICDLPKVMPGHCVRISTGAAIPAAANAVVQIEDTTVVSTHPDGEEKEISINKTPQAGQDIRRAGSDIPLDDGKCLISRGSLLTPVELGLIASVGVNTFAVCGRPSIAVMSTGDEIVPPGDPRPGTCIWDSNRTVLLSLLKSCHYNVFDLGIVLDDVHLIYGRIKTGLEKADVLITTGGVSMGERDLIKKILLVDFNATIHFGRVEMKPGKPTTFATCRYANREKYIFALPGNPVSAFVTFQLFVKPSLAILSGKQFELRGPSKLLSLHQRIKCRLSLQAPYKLDERPEFVRAIITFDSDDANHFLPRAELTDRNQISSRLLNVKDANGMVLLAKATDKETFIIDGTIVNAILL